ncbi:MAG TPA: peptidylprolyl isomerase [Bellilinea sp.]|nr:peptidylprolyl isomerase [Bellilinea sp.]
MMRKYWLAAALLALLILAACSPAAPTAESSVPMACTLQSVFGDEVDPASVNLPEVTAADWSRGPEDARLMLVEYSDFQCPYCSIAGRSLHEFQVAHPDQVRVVFRNFPLPSHDKAPLSAQAAEAAGLQGKFWEMHDLLFLEANWDAWTAMSVDDFQTWVIEQAGTLGLDNQKFTKDLTSATLVDKVNKGYGSAIASDLNSTPSLFVFVDGKLTFLPSDQIPYDLDTLELLLTLSELKEKEFTACPPTVVDPNKEYSATIKTSKGDFTVELFADKAPLAVNSFVYLAQQGWFDNVSWHRVLPDFVAQTGDPSGTGFGGPGYIFKNETSDSLKFDRAGLLAMANSGADTNGSQFFITYAEAPSLDGGYTIFGEVTSGMDVVEKLTPRNPAEEGELPVGDTILSVSIEVK